MNKPLVTLTSDFGIQTQGCGIMKAVVLEINPNANVVHLMHGLPDFDISTAARTMETVSTIQVGFHVCVVDPGVGTRRKGIAIKTKRGDYLIGPDNGVLIPATNILGGCEKVVELSNPKYMKHPVSPIFHGRDVFSPAAGHLSVGVPVEEFGEELKFEDLVRAPYEEAIVKKDQLEAKVIHINKFGSLHLNVLASAWDQFGVAKKVSLKFQNTEIEVPFVKTFGKVPKNNSLIMEDDYGRIEVAINMGSFAETYHVSAGDKCLIKKV
ncbi:SAM-dependent chlorinase/fluorinase [archaeon]|nr:SAM-dependent chlorinase/fluorinase [archaeon]MBL7057667.1 SAM-dependent chlorinase/fluorinase [Candidatus Woesearchaeota archaeon]